MFPDQIFGEPIFPNARGLFPWFILDMLLYAWQIMLALRSSSIQRVKMEEINDTHLGRMLSIRRRSLRAATPRSLFASLPQIRG